MKVHYFEEDLDRAKRAMEVALGKMHTHTEAPLPPNFTT